MIAPENRIISENTIYEDDVTQSAVSAASHVEVHSDEKAVEDQLVVAAPHMSADDSMIWRENLLQQQFASPTPRYVDSFERATQASSAFYSPYQNYSGSFSNETFAHASPYMLNFHHSIQNFGQETTIVRTEQCPSCGSRGYVGDFSPDPTNNKIFVCRKCQQKSSRDKKVKKECFNCKTSNTTLWRKFKSLKDIRLKYPNKDFDQSSADPAGKVGCNACALYWSLHGKHRPADMKRSDTPTRRRRKKNGKDFPQLFNMEMAAAAHHQQQAWTAVRNPYHQAAYPMISPYALHEGNAFIVKEESLGIGLN